MNLRQPLLILSIVLIIGIAAVSIFAYNQSSEISTLSEQKTNLETSKADLMGQVVELQAGITEISGTIMNLETQLTDLETEKETENQQLIQDISSKEESITALEAELAEAKTQLSELSEQIVQLLAQIEDLEQGDGSGPGDDPALNNVQRHLDPSIMAVQNCTECHAQVAEQAIAGESNIYHNAMLNNNLLNFNCVDCHKSVDILSESEDLSRVIDSTTCVKCHTTFPNKMWMSFEDNAKDFASQFPDCAGCHTDWKIKMVDATFVNIDVITDNDCRTCHLDNALPQFFVERGAIPIDCGKCHE